MKVIIASTIVPFIMGGGTFIVDWLEEELAERGHQVETLRLPFASYYPDMPEQMLGLRLLDVGATADRLIAIRTPSYVLRHPNKVVWFIHHHRTAYDLWDTPYRDIPDTQPGLSYRDAIVQADNVALREARALFTNSGEVAGRLRQYNGLNAEVLYPPLRHPERYRSLEYGDYVYYPSRLTHHKRQHLLMDALRHTRTPVRLVISGVPENDAYLAHLQAIATEPGIASRIELITDWITEERKIELFSRSLAAAYLPLAEDSYGYPSLEAHAAERAVITTKDAGGTSELIVHERNGFIVDPTPEAIAAALDSLYNDRGQARAMGLAGKARIEELGITWDQVVERLLA